MKKTVVFVLLGFVLIALGAVFSGVFHHPADPTPEQQALIDQMKHGDDLRKKGDCPDQEILVRIGEVKLKVPRKSLSVTREDGTQPYHDIIRYDCSVKVLEKVGSVRMLIHKMGDFEGRIDISVSSTDKYSDTTYSRSKNILFNSPKLVTNIETGVTLDPIINDYYTLSKKEAPTSNGEPVLISCGKDQNQPSLDFCSTYYFVTPELRLGYIFFKADVSIDEYMRFDKDMRQYLESITVKEGNKKNGL